MKYLKSIFLLGLILCLAPAFPIFAGAKTKWQNKLEGRGVPSLFWQKYLPDINRGDYNNAIASYMASLSAGASSGSTNSANTSANSSSNDNSSDSNDNSSDDSSDSNIIKGKYPLPDSSGEIAAEQHLWLSGNQSASKHYKMTNTPKSCQNGMAGGYGAFGTLGSSDKQEEEYYITMRWGYADWTEPASNLTLSLGKNDVSLQLKDASDFPKSGYVKIGSEYLHYSSKSGNKLKGLARGYKSSTHTHSKSDSVKLEYRYEGGQWEQVTRALNINSKKMDWYKEKKVLVTNKRNGKQVVASILDAGPAIWTGRAGGLSPEAFAAIKAKNNEDCTFQYVNTDTKLGPVK